MANPIRPDRQPQIVWFLLVIVGVILSGVGWYRWLR